MHHRAKFRQNCGEAPTEAMYMKLCVVGDVLDVITCAKFQNEIFRGFNFTGGRIFHFPIDFEWALQQCSATALPVIESQNLPYVHFRYYAIALSGIRIHRRRLMCIEN